eukprot:1203970-Pleurochrysis_carterae.AAC.1
MGLGRSRSQPTRWSRCGEQRGDGLNGLEAARSGGAVGRTTTARCCGAVEVLSWWGVEVSGPLETEASLVSRGLEDDAEIKRVRRAMSTRSSREGVFRRLAHTPSKAHARVCAEALGRERSDETALKVRTHVSASTDM